MSLYSSDQIVNLSLSIILGSFFWGGGGVGRGGNLPI